MSSRWVIKHVNMLVCTHLCRSVLYVCVYVVYMCTCVVCVVYMCSVHVYILDTQRSRPSYGQRVWMVAYS